MKKENYWHRRFWWKGETNDGLSPFEESKKRWNKEYGNNGPDWFIVFLITGFLIMIGIAILQ